MGARSGNNYLSTLKKFNAEVWIAGERVREITSHPAFSRSARALASLYDLQMERPEAMTFRTDDGGRSGLSLLQPRSPGELHKRGRMIKVWAEFGCGFFNPTPDRTNVILAAMAAAHEFFAANEARYADNLQNYYHQACHRDWCMAQALLDPDVPGLGVKLVEESAERIVVNGVRMLAALAPMAEELLVLPGSGGSVEENAFACAIPCNTPGLSFMCGSNGAQGLSSFDHPLSSRFNVAPCAAIFDRVKIPRDRVFLCGDVARCDAMLAETGAGAHQTHQAAIRGLARVEFLLGLAGRIAEVSNPAKRGEVYEDLAGIVPAAETMRSHLEAAEAQASANKWGIFVPAPAQLESAQDLHSRIFPRLIETIASAVSSSLPAPPCEADFANPALQPALDRYFASADCDARNRTALFRLAWDAVEIASRDLHSPPISSLQTSEARESAGSGLKPMIDRVKSFLARAD